MNGENKGVNICVMLGANIGHQKNYREATELFAYYLVQGGHTLVYGGGKLGLMGILADAVLKYGGRVIGITTPLLFEIEGHTHLTKTYIVNSIFERKQKMEEMADAFVALPGGLGTLDELMNFWNLFKMGLMAKPVGMLNTFHYYDIFMQVVQHMIDQGFLNIQHQEDLLVTDDPHAMIKQIVERIKK